MDKAVTGVILLGVISGLSDGAGLLPDTMTAAEGGKVMFTTVSPPDGPFRLITWSFGDKTIIVGNPDPGNPLPGYEGRVTLFPDTGSLELRSLSLNDSGEYTVRITPTAGNERTGTTTLEVVERISNSSITTTHAAIEGKNFNLTCVAYGSMLTRKWLKDGSDLTLSDNITLDDDNRVLSFQPLNRANRGVYSCNITNPISTMEAKYTVVVNYGPDKAQIEGESKTNTGNIFTLTCSAESEPSASFTWILNGEMVHSSAEYEKKAELSDAGNYTCQAKNSKTGRSSSAMHGLTVTESTDGGLSAGAISGIVIACLIVVAAAAAAGGYVFYQKNGGKPQPTSPELPRQEQTHQNPNPAFVKPDPMVETPNKEYDIFFENPDLKYENPDLTYENTDLTYKNPDLTYENPDLTYKNPDLTYENPDLTYENPDLTYENPDLTYENPDREYVNLRPHKN